MKLFLLQKATKEKTVVGFFYAADLEQARSYVRVNNLQHHHLTGPVPRLDSPSRTTREAYRS